ncbi:MAG: hypothetical protein ABIJ46_04070 [bacterium]
MSKQVEFYGPGKGEWQGETKPLEGAVLADFGRPVIDCSRQVLPIDAELVNILGGRSHLGLYDAEFNFPRFVGVVELISDEGQDDLPWHLVVFQEYLIIDRLGPAESPRIKACLFAVIIDRDRQQKFRNIRRWVEQQTAAIPAELDMELRRQKLLAKFEMDDLSVARKRVEALAAAGLDPATVEADRGRLFREHGLA